MRFSGIAAGIIAVSGLIVGAAPLSASAANAMPTARAGALVTCTLSGSTTFAKVGDAKKGLTSTEARDIKITGQNTAICVDARLNKSATGGRTITGFTSKTQGSFTNSKCLEATGSIVTSVTWYLNTGDPLTSDISSKFALANVLEALPGTGTVTNGLFATASAQTNSVFTSVGNDVKCNSDEGITNTTRTTTLTIEG